jgi:hypothetical protein
VDQESPSAVVWTIMQISNENGLNHSGSQPHSGVVDEGSHGLKNSVFTVSTDPNLPPRIVPTALLALLVRLRSVHPEASV